MPRLIAKISSLLLLLVLALVLSERAAPALARDSGSISGRVINDLNVDGVSEAGEQGLAGWRVVLEGNVGEDNGTSVSYETKTNRDGEYFFTGLSAGSYLISVPCDGQPHLAVFTGPEEQPAVDLRRNIHQDGEDMLLSLVDSLPATYGTIVGRVVLDENRDGVPDPSESGLVGWRVEAWLQGSECLQSEPVSAVGQTAGDGTFRLSELIPGRYSVGVTDQEESGDFVIDSPGVERQFQGRSVLELSNEVGVGGAASASITIGVLSIKGTGSISGELYYDLNLNGSRDPGEPLWSGYTWLGLSYRTPNGYVRVSRPLTYVGGRYEYTGLAAGDYVVGNVSFLGSGVNPPAGEREIPEAVIILGEGEQKTGVDFGSNVQPPDPVPTEVPFPTPEPTSPVPPTPVPSTPAPSSPGGSSPSTGAIGVPNTGTGDDSDLAATPWLAAALGAGGLALIAGLTLATRWRRRGRETF